MAKKKMLFIYNPKAGKGQIKNNLSDIIDIFVKAGNEVTVYPTQYAGDAVRMAAEKSKKYDLLVWHYAEQQAGACGLHTGRKHQ